MIGPSGFMAGPKIGDKMICKHAPKGFQYYPDFYCPGDCEDSNCYESASHPVVNKIRAMRHKTGMTQRQLADRLHVSERTYIRWESEGSISNGAALELLTELSR